MTHPVLGQGWTLLSSATVEDTGHRVALVATSPAQRAARRARPAVLTSCVLAAVATFALLLLPVGPILTWIMGLAPATLLVTFVVSRKLTGSIKPLSGAVPLLQATAFASAFLVGGTSTRYFTSLLLAPWLGPPEPPTTTLLWTAPLVAATTAFMVWAARPIHPRSPR